MAGLKLPEVNKVECVGLLTRDPDVRYTSTGKPFCRFTVACNETYKSGGEIKTVANFIPCSCFDKLAAFCGENLKKGTPVMVMGKLHSYTSEKGGVKTYGMGVTALSVENLSAKEEPEPENDSQPSDAAPEEEIPF